MNAPQAAAGKFSAGELRLSAALAAALQAVTAAMLAGLLMWARGPSW